MYLATEEEPEVDDPNKDAKGGPPGANRYVAPGMRGDGPGAGRGGVDGRRDENTCRVSNLPQDCEEYELRDLFGSIGRVQVLSIVSLLVNCLARLYFA